MKTASITEAKNNLSALIDGLKNGAPVLITDRGRPVARLEPVTVGESERDERLAELVRDRLVRPRRKPLSKSFLRAELPAVKASLVDALI
jgi:prevent-host-death family protein